MLEITIPARDIFVESTNEFISIKEAHLQLEHSLISIKKWEAKWHKPYLHTDNKSTEMILDYIKCMTLNKPSDDRVYYGLTKENIDDITKYITDPMTATWFSAPPKKEGQSNIKKEIYTAEVIYYQMIELGIPVEFQKWHLNQLLTLIRVISAKRSEGEHKTTPQEAAMRRQALNAKRKARWHSRG